MRQDGTGRGGCGGGRADGALIVFLAGAGWEGISGSLVTGNTIRNQTNKSENRTERNEATRNETNKQTNNEDKWKAKSFPSAKSEQGFVQQSEELACPRLPHQMGANRAHFAVVHIPDIYSFIPCLARRIKCQ